MDTSDKLLSLPHLNVTKLKPKFSAGYTSLLIFSFGIGLLQPKVLFSLKFKRYKEGIGVIRF